ncbi:MAG: hypothetical protein K8S97_11230, partial [Anaerolineae bacterium]|nr:hypothetical protein [Anaerolineae bacterium]
RVAATQADMALNHLLLDTEAHRPFPANTVILANTHMEIFEGKTAQPYMAEWVSVPRNPECLVCSDQHRSAEEATEVSLDQLASLGNVTLEEDNAQ